MSVVLGGCFDVDTNKESSFNFWHWNAEDGELDVNDLENRHRVVWKLGQQKYPWRLNYICRSNVFERLLEKL